MTFESTNFPLVSDVPTLLQKIKIGRSAALRLPTLNYRETRLRLQQGLEEQFGKDSRQYADVLLAPLHCTGCLWEYPQSYCNRLFLDEKSRQVFGPIAGAEPGYKQFAETGLCPLCGSGESLLLYEYYPGEAIDERDLEAIRRYWQDQAHQWWRLAEERELSCAECDAPISRDEGFLANDTLICAACAARKLGSALEDLRSYPHYFGNNLLRKARPYRELK